jgi:hypothetical protein
MAKNEIREYLESLISSAQEGGHIVPPPEAAHKIADEIQRRTNLTVQNLAGLNVATVERIVSAHPAHFVDETLRAIGEAVASLEENQAREFEVALPIGQRTQTGISVGLN